MIYLMVSNILCFKAKIHKRLKKILDKIKEESTRILLATRRDNNNNNNNNNIPYSSRKALFPLLLWMIINLFGLTTVNWVSFYNEV